MKTSIGGDRLGSGNKQNVNLKEYSRSTHDLSYIWRSSMSAGTLVPFMSLVGLSGDSFDIDLDCNVLTLPTIGPLFGSFKVQLDVFSVPVRLYNASLHMNKLGIGMDMSKVYLPFVDIRTKYEIDGFTAAELLDDNAQINPSSLHKYLGISGIGRPTKGGTVTATTSRRSFNAVPYLAYFDIFKQYYANKQEDLAYGIHISSAALDKKQTPKSVLLYEGGNAGVEILDTVQSAAAGEAFVRYYFEDNVSEPDPNFMRIAIGGTDTNVDSYFDSFVWDDDVKSLLCQKVSGTAVSYQVLAVPEKPIGGLTDYSPVLESFELKNIDLMREKILQADTSVPFNITEQTAAHYVAPYSWLDSSVSFGGQQNGHSAQFSQDCLLVKTYQSDLFNNWISTEWIDGANGISAVTAVDTSAGSFSIDALNLASKVYVMLNRIAISGGSYDDWLDAVYTHERARSVESPVYMGSLIKELAFDAVVSNADTQQVDQKEGQPLGTLAGRGHLTGKNKGGKIKVKVDEPSYIMGIVSLTPKVDYSNGNSFDMNFKTMNDFHKPALDAIGYQSLITEQMAWQSSDNHLETAGDAEVIFKSAGKQPAWINYMTAVNKTYGNFAIESKEMYMTLNRRYDIDVLTGNITDLTTYIDPTKFNQIFAQTSLDAQNFWVQISNGVTARRKMSAKIIPNL